MERGISPLLSFAILIGLLVSMTVIFFAWSYSLIPPLLPPPTPEPGEITCSDVNLKIKSSCYREYDQEKELIFTIESSGKAEVNKFLVRVDNGEIRTGEIGSLRPFGISSFTVSDTSEEFLDYDLTKVNNIEAIPFILINVLSNMLFIIL